MTNKATKCPYGCEQFLDVDSRCDNCNATMSQNLDFAALLADTIAAREIAFVDATCVTMRHNPDGTEHSAYADDSLEAAMFQADPFQFNFPEDKRGVDRVMARLLLAGEEPFYIFEQWFGRDYLESIFH